MKSIIAITIAAVLFSTAAIAGQSEVADYFKSNQERKVLDAVWTSATVLKLGMINDGTSRNGFAQYACEVIYDYGYRGSRVWIQIIDIAKLKRSGKWERIGQAKCL